MDYKEILSYLNNKTNFEYLCLLSHTIRLKEHAPKSVKSYCPLKVLLAKVSITIAGN